MKVIVERISGPMQIYYNPIHYNSGSIPYLNMKDMLLV